MPALTGLALLVALIASMAIWLIRGRAEALGRSPAITRRELRTYLRLRAGLERLPGFLGAVIGLGALGSAELQRVYVSLPGHDKADFPPEGVILDGMVLSFLVALACLPAFATLQRAGARIRDSAEGLPEPGDPLLGARLAKRKALGELLKLQFSARASFRAGVAILSPLLASLTSLLPGLGR
jgi:hypothetical protein